MKKKILAVALATMMVVSSAVSAFAATVADVDASGWWVAHSEGIEVTEAGVTVTFHSDSSSYSDATNNWNTPIYVLYTADTAFAGGADFSSQSGYSEYFVCRSDCYAWEGAAIDGAGNSAEGLAASTFESTAPEDWTTWLADCVDGIDCTLTASLADGNVTITFTVGDASSTAVVPVGSVTPYISLTGELCTLTNITVSTASSEADTDAASDDDAEAATEAATEAAAAASDDDAAAATEAATTPQTGDVATFASIAIVAAAAVAIVALRKRVTE